MIDINFISRYQISEKGQKTIQLTDVCFWVQIKLNKFKIIKFQDQKPDTGNHSNCKIMWDISHNI